MSSSHFVNTCQYGTTHGQCRCPSPSKVIETVNCPTPDVCGSRYKPKHRKDVPARDANTPEQDTHIVSNMDTMVIDYLPLMHDGRPAASNVRGSLWGALKDYVEAEDTAEIPRGYYDGPPTPML